MSGNAQFRSLDIKLEISVARPSETAWRSLTAGIGEWWLKAFYVGSAPKRFAIEPQVGGRVFEDWGGGEGALFGTVTAYEENRMLQWAGEHVRRFRRAGPLGDDLPDQAFRRWHVHGRRVPGHALRAAQ